MKKAINIGEKEYFIETTIYNNSNGIEVKAYFETESPYKLYSKDQYIVYKKEVYPSRILELLGKSLEYRLERTIQKAMKVLEIYDKKKTILRTANKTATETFDLDKHMDV